MDLREVGCVPGDLIALAEDREQWCAYVRAELLLIIVTILFLSHFYFLLLIFYVYLFAI